MKIVIELPGTPHGKERPRFGRGGVYTSAKTAAYERALGLQAMVDMRKVGFSHRLTGPINMAVTAFMPIPESWNRSNRMNALSGAIRPQGRPDWDNLGKIASDSLNGIAYVDDSQIVTATVSKLYAATPLLRVEISPVDTIPDASLEKEEPVG